MPAALASSSNQRPFGAASTPLPAVLTKVALAVVSTTASPARVLLSAVPVCSARPSAWMRSCPVALSAGPVKDTGPTLLMLSVPFKAFQLLAPVRIKPS